MVDEDSRSADAESDAAQEHHSLAPAAMTPEEESWAARRRAYRDFVRTPEYPPMLTRAFESYVEPVRFMPGDLVEWKPLLRNRVYPSYGAPVVVVNYLESPISRNADGEVEIEPDDIVLGLLTGDREFLALSFVSRRFRAWRGGDGEDQDPVGQ